MKTNKTAWAVIIGCIVFAGCQSNNKPVAQNTDTSVSAAIKDNGDDLAAKVYNPVATPVNTIAPTTTTNVAPASGYALIDTTTMICVPKYKKVHHQVAYTGHKRAKKNVKKTTETTVATVEPVTPPEPIKEDKTVVIPNTPVTPPAPEPTTVEKQTEFTGNIPNAPKPRAKVHLAPEAGITLNNFYMQSDDFQTSNQLKVGFSGGVMVNVELGRRWGFEPGVRYIMKGGQQTNTTMDAAGITTEHKEKLTFHYVEMPVNFVYNTGDWGTSRFMIGAGPYIAYLANAQDKTKDKIYLPEGPQVITGQHSIPTGDPSKNPGYVRNYDAGANAFIGYQVRNGMYIKAGAEIGFLDLQHNSNGFYDRNYNFLGSVGYMFGYKK